VVCSFQFTLALAGFFMVKIFHNNMHFCQHFLVCLLFLQKTSSQCSLQFAQKLLFVGMYTSVGFRTKISKCGE